MKKFSLIVTLCISCLFYSPIYAKTIDAQVGKSTKLGYSNCKVPKKEHTWSKNYIVNNGIKGIICTECGKIKDGTAIVIPIF